MPSHSRGSTLTPCRSPTPFSIPVQPDHFYGTEHIQLPPSPDSDGKTWLDPADDPLAHRGIPVFKPTMEQFQDFEGYMNSVECWGMRSGIVKVIPPKEWTASLPDIKPQLENVKIKTPIEQHMLGRGGLFRQENMEKRKLMSVREWVELCTKDEFRAPGVQEVGLSARNFNTPPVRTRPPPKGKQKAAAINAEASGSATTSVVIKEEPMDHCHSFDALPVQTVATPPNSEGTPPPAAQSQAGSAKTNKSKKKKPTKQEPKQEPKPRRKRVGQTREAREASLAERAARDRAFLEVFDPDDEWLPPNTSADDYTPEFCQKLERQYWRNCGLGKPAWYGADTQGSLFTEKTTAWNVAHLPSALSRLLPSSDQGVPGVNTPYLYFGMWRATFAWHVEDMDLFSINYIHFGAPKFWYAIPQGRAAALESTMRGYFPKDTSQCPQFLRHKSFLASPSLLANSSCKPNHLVQQAGEFVITYPRGYHAGFNLGLNCAESVNFALESWLDIGRRAKVCECISDSVRIDVDELLRLKEEEVRQATLPKNPPSTKNGSSKKAIVKKEAQEDSLPPPKAPSRKRKSDVSKEDAAPKLKKIKIKHTPVKPPLATISIPASKPVPKLSITLKLGPRPAEPEPFPCCLCVSMNKEGLLRVHEPPLSRKDAVEAAGNPKIWMAHEYCASIVPETWVDWFNTPTGREKVVYGVDGIVKDRWNLKCSACSKAKPKAHGAPVQCTKGKCPKAFHVDCARDGHASGIVFEVVQEVEKEVIVLGPAAPTISSSSTGFGNHMPIATPGAQSLSGTAAMSGAPAPVSLRYTPEPEPHILKTIKKLEVQILCTQHNPAVAAQKKASKNDKIRSDLLALPSMSRIKIRVSAGVFEVSLIRVIEETSSVEVLWDRGVTREFKWGSVVFGNTEGPVLQKPSDGAALLEPKRPSSSLVVPTYSSVQTATTHNYTGVIPYSASISTTSVGEDRSTIPPSEAQAQPTPSGSSTPSNLIPTLSQSYTPGQTPTLYPPRTAPTSYADYWAYAASAQAQYASGQAAYGAAQTSYQYPYVAYYGNAGQQQQYNPYTSHAQAYNRTHSQQRGAALHWQQPYQGPSTGASAGQSSQTQVSQHYREGSQTTSMASSSQITPTSSKDTTTSSTYGNQQETSAAATPSSNTQNTSQSTAPALNSQQQQQAMRDLAALSSLEPAQIQEILLGNPQLREMVLAAVDQARLTVTA